MLRAGFLGPPNGAAAARPRGDGLLFSSVARAVDHRTAPDRPFTVQWEFEDAEPWHVQRQQRLDARPPPAERLDVDLEVRCRYEDWVDIVAGRLDPRRALVTRRLRPHGSPRALWAARTLFG